MCIVLIWVINVRESVVIKCVTLLAFAFSGKHIFWKIFPNLELLNYLESLLQILRTNIHSTEDAKQCKVLSHLQEIYHLEMYKIEFLWNINKRLFTQIDLSLFNLLSPYFLISLTLFFQCNYLLHGYCFY